MELNQQMHKKKVVLITGCGSGIGYSLAELFYDRTDYHVVITAREHSVQMLSQRFTESPRFWIRELDVLDDSMIYRVVNEICCEWGQIDILVNNAGVCFRSVIEHMDVQSEMLQLGTNYLGPMALIRSVLPVMREQRSGHIVNVSSVSGMVAMPTMASYSASKHALEGATESLWYEARPYGINVSLVQPGFVHSDSFKNVRLSNKAQVSSMLGGPHSEYYTSMTPFIEKLMSFSMTSSADIAKKVIKTIERKHPPLRVFVTLDAMVFRVLRWFLPSQLFHKIMFAFLPGSLNWGKPVSRFRKPDEFLSKTV